jgi:hypothetical protein
VGVARWDTVYGSGGGPVTGPGARAAEPAPFPQASSSRSGVPAPGMSGSRPQPTPITQTSSVDAAPTADRNSLHQPQASAPTRTAPRPAHVPPAGQTPRATSSSGHVAGHSATLPPVAHPGHGGAPAATAALFGGPVTPALSAPRDPWALPHAAPSHPAPCVLPPVSPASHPGPVEVVRQPPELVSSPAGGESLHLRIRLLRSWRVGAMEWAMHSPLSFAATCIKCAIIFLLFWLRTPSEFLVVFEKPNRSSFS